ncbi:CBP80/20-dependent translation initiation factor-like [Ruditapes philippinarum]|uniref:CBP80/20-dependent translation initiation factor-like n=1 Tax=Ruditapes philippinarum TaxID=129788 RepID=UPI00295B3F4C|nr:CBP80/20-dependent translation initiation factor-like [Ruditapes philippinarum]
MAAAGRGRGRGRGLLARELPEDAQTRPGSIASEDAKVSENGVEVKKEGTSKQDSLLELQHILDNLTLDVSDHDLNELYQLAESASNTDNDIKHVTEQVYSKFTSDREYAKTGAFICEKLASLEVNGTKFRSLLLSMIQADYKDKDSLRSKSVSKFLNILSFMCQVFGTMRTAGGEVFKPLVSPLYECFNMILDSEQCDNDEYECLNEQLQSIGRDLEQSDRDKMEQMMFKIRSKVIRNGSTPQARCTLLEIIECHCRGWKDLANDVTRFYCDTMMDILTD